MPSIQDIRRQLPDLEGLSDEQAVDFLQQVYYPSADRADLAQRLGVKLAVPEPAPRSLMAVANDTVIEAANAAAGGASAVGNFVAPGNRVSKFIDDEFIRAGEESQSDAVKAEKQRFRDEVAAADGIGGELGAVGGYVLRNPLLSAAQAAGSFVGPGAAIKGAQAGARALGAGAQGVARAGLAGGAAAGAGMAGGDAAGTAYELVINAGGSEAEAIEAARGASVIPAVVGGVGGVFGAERLFAGLGRPGGSLMARALRAGGSEAVQEGIEEGITHYEGQRAAVPFDPTIDPSKGAFAAAGMGAALGGVTGAGVSLLARDQQREDATKRLAEAGSVDAAIAAATDLANAPLEPIAPVGISAEQENKAMGAMEAQAKADHDALKQTGRMDKTGAPRNMPRSQMAQDLDAAAEGGAEVIDAPFGDRVLSLRESLADPDLRDRVRAQFGEEALNEATYFAGIADRAGTGLPDKTRDNLLAVAEAIVSRASLRPINEPAPALGSNEFTAPEQIGMSARAPQIGLDTTPTGTMRVDAKGNAAPETRADTISTRERVDAMRASRDGMTAPAVNQPRTGGEPLAIEMDTTPTGRMVAGSQGVQAETRADAINLRQRVDAIKARRQERADIGLTPDVERAAAVRASGEVQAAAQQAATSPTNDLPEPTEAQKKAGNYKLGHSTWNGLDLSFENPKGSERKGVDPDGKPWAVKMPAHYGYVKRTTGADGDHVDIYMGDNPASTQVFVVDQKDAKTGKWDEHKVMLGTDSIDEATALYDAGFSDGRGPDRRGAVTAMTVDAFKDWLKNGDTTKPLGKPQAKPPLDRAARARARMAFNPETDGVLQALAKMGGVARDVMAREFGLKPEELKHTVSVGGLKGFPFRKNGGMQMDRAIEALQEAGYFAGMANEDVRAAFEEAIYGELGGGRTLTPAGQMRRGAEETEDRARQEREELDAENAAEDAAERAAIMAEAGIAENGMATLADDDIDLDAASNTDTEAFMRSMGFDEQEIADELARESARRGAQGNDRQAGETATGEARPPAGARSEEARSVPAEEGLTPEEANARAGELVSAFRHRFAKAPSEMTTEQFHTFAADRRVANEALAQNLLRLAQRSDGLLLPQKWGHGFIALHADPRADGDWRITRFADDMEPSGHMEFNKPVEAAAQFATDAKAAAAAAPDTGLTLEAQDDATLKAKTDREARAAADDAREQKRRADKAKADAERDEFTLTGSDRAVDVGAAAGQNGLFDAPAAPAPAPVKPEAPTLKQRVDKKRRKPDTTPIADAGEKIGGARKDRWKERGLNVADLDSMSESEGAELATKANVWKPDYAQMAEAGAPAELAALVKGVYDSLAAKPKDNTPAGRRRYVTMMQAVRDVYDATVKLAQVNGANPAQLMRGAAEALKARIGIHGTDKAATDEARKVLFSVYKGRSDPFVLGYNEQARAKKLVSDGFPAAIDPWKRRLNIVSRGSAGTTERGVEIYVEASAKAGTPVTAEQVKAGVFVVRTKTGKELAYLPTMEDAEAAARTLYEAMGQGKDTKPEPSRPHLDDLKREGLEQAIDRDATPDDFLRDFGFRGVEFGNWSAQDERQRILNMAYDGLADLARLMNVPRRAMSLNGTLGMAFGARGSGRALAHYEPGKLVINMTKLRGGGSMAHEWAHALDHYFGEIERADAYQTDARGASGWYAERDYSGVPRKRTVRDGDKWVTREEMALPNVRPELAQAFDGVMEALFQKRIDKATMVRELELDLERTQSLAGKETDPELKAMYQRGAEAQRKNLDEARKEPEDKTFRGRGRSEYAGEAQKLSGKSANGYWLRPTEMFARAFESYIFDRLAAMGARSDYLVHGVEAERFAGGAYKGNPYPTGEERARINAAFDKLVAEVKTREDDAGNVAMFSRVATPEAAALKALSENDDLFALPKSQADTVEGIAADHHPDITVRKVTSIPGETRYNFTLPSGKTARMVVRPANPYGKNPYGFDYADGELSDVLDARPGENPEDVPATDDVWIDVSLLESGDEGRTIYNIAATYAHNTGRIFIGDPAGLSNEAMRRRPEQMLSSALKFGTTAHLAPHPRQVTGDARLGIPPLKWVYGDDLGNIERLIDVNLAALENAGADTLTFDPQSGQFLDTEGQPLSRGDIAELAKAGYGRGALAGGKTLARGSVLRALSREARQGVGRTDGRRDGLLARLLRQSAVHESATRGIFYSRDGVTAPEPHSRAAEVKALVDKITSRWANAPKVVVVENIKDPKLPPGLRENNDAQKSKDAEGEPAGALYGGTVYLFADQLHGDIGVVNVLFHEALGHYGLRSVFGPELGSILDRFARLNPGRVRAKAKQYGLDYDKPTERRMAAEEVFAEMAQTSPEVGWVKRAIAAIRTWLRDHVPGFDGMAYSDDEIVRNFIEPARRFVKDGDGGPRGAGRMAGDAGPAMFDRAAPTDSAAFKKWFGDSKVVDADGKPLVVYHGTMRDIAAFDKARYGQTDHGTAGVGIYAATGREHASAYAKKFVLGGYIHDGGNVMPLHMSIENPAPFGKAMEVKAALIKAKRAAGETDASIESTIGKDVTARLQAMGHDGVSPDTTGKWAFVGDVWVAFEPGQVKSATGNRGTFDGANPNIMFSRTLGATLESHMNDVRAVNLPAGYKVQDFIDSHGKLSWWDKTVGTMYNLAQRSPQFKRVFDATQNFINDTSYYATQAADLAPNILPKLDKLKDIGKSPLSAEDTKAVSAPIFEGTLTWGRDERGRAVPMAELERRAAALGSEGKARELLRARKLSEGVLKMWQGLPIDQYESLIEGKYARDMLRAGVVWTDGELRSQFNLNDKQIGLYREFRAATDKSLTSLAVSDMIRFGGDDVAAVRDAAMEAESVDAAAEMLRDHLFAMAEKFPDRADVLNDAGNKMIDKAERATDLMQRGYAPLSRFGNYTVYVTEGGEQRYFGMFESQFEANRMARKMQAEFPGATVEQGTVSQEAFKLFAGVSPETLELFGEMLGLEQQGGDPASKAFQSYLKLAKSNRSAMKRLIERKGIAGFSEDAGRVLAGFVYSNGRQASSNLHMGEMIDATAAIERSDGELKDAAVRLVDYIKNPQEEAQAFRGLLFAQYLGGSVASALVNMTQPLAVTFPWLSQFGGVRKAAAQMTAAVRDAGKKSTGDKVLDAALKKAEEDGIVSPQEVHQLMAQARGAASLKSGDGTAVGDAAAKVSNALAKFSLAWGKLFSAAEQVNRRVTFIAAYRTAVEQGMADPAAFAEKAISETQFVYNKANKPRWARGAIGGTLFTFKTYSVSYVELLARTAKSGPEGRKAALLMIAMLALVGGAEGLPFAGDLDDVIDGALQHLGYNFSAKRARDEFLAGVLGEDGARFVLNGITGLPGAPIDLSGRLGMGNLIPGTGLFTKKTDHARDVAEIFGPAGDLVKRGATAAALAVQGDVLKAGETAAPLAARNLVKGYDMAVTGMYRDTRGRKVIDTEGFEALSKAIGFQPAGVARVQEATWQIQQAVALNKMRETEIADRWAQGMFEGNADKVRAARDELSEWNAANPASPIKISSGQIIKRLKSMRQTKTERIAGTAPKEIRESVRRELENAR